MTGYGLKETKGQTVQIRRIRIMADSYGLCIHQRNNDIYYLWTIIAYKSIGRSLLYSSHA